MSFRSVFIAIGISFALILSAFLVQRARPRIEVEQPTADFVKATGKCAECHANQQYSVVYEYELSKHAAKGISTAEVCGGPPSQVAHGIQIYGPNCGTKSVMARLGAATLGAAQTRKRKANFN